MLDSETLTDRQFAMVCDARAYPVVLHGRARKVTAKALERKGWGDVEDGASGERIFRLNPACEPEIAWLEELVEA